jgi:hypothetical protein
VGADVLASSLIQGLLPADLRLKILALSIR